MSSFAPSEPAPLVSEPPSLPSASSLPEVALVPLVVVDVGEVPGDVSGATVVASLALHPHVFWTRSTFRSAFPTFLILNTCSTESRLAREAMGGISDQGGADCD